MLARGGLGTPYFSGQPFLLKPILIYWLIAAAFRLLGPTEFAARVTSAFLGIALVMLTYWFGARTLSRRAGFLAGLALALNYMWLDIARDASIDVPLTAALAPGVFLFFLAMKAPARRKRLLYLGAYALFGVALLAKGPVPVGVVGCGLLAYLLAARRLRETLRGAQLPLGVPLMLAVAAPWYIYEQVRQPAFFATFFLGEHFGHIHGELARRMPVWGNLEYLLIYFYPWAAFLPAALAHAFRQTDRGHVLRLMAWWSISVVAIFSLPQSKLAHYLAPAFPALAILVGGWLDDWLLGRTEGRGWAAGGFALLGLAGAACGAAAVIAGMTPPWLQERLARQFGEWRPGLSAVVILGALALGSLAAAGVARWRRNAVAPVLACAMALAGMAYVGWFNPRRAEIQAQPRKELAQLAAVRLPESAPLGVYYAKRNATVFYFGRPIVDLGEREDEFAGLVRFLSSPTPAAAITHARFLPELRRSVPGLRVWDQRGDYVLVANRLPTTAGRSAPRQRSAPARFRLSRS